MANQLRRRLSFKTLAAVLAAAVLAGCGVAALRLDSNFHAIVEGEAYRSAQPSPNEIAAYRRQYGIATIINLRGNQEGRTWYDEEVLTAKHLGIEHLDFGMSARKELKPDEARALIALMKKAAKPVLIHCKAGSDRSGLAAALYMAAIKGADKEDAEKQLSLRFGHIAVPLVGTYAMDRTFVVIEPSIRFRGS